LDCACRGWADEYLLAAVDSVFSPGLTPEAAAQHLASWGASSGRDFWAGVWAATQGLTLSPAAQDA
jgi:hypothetical protein